MRHVILAASALLAASCGAPCTLPPAGCATGGTGTITVTSTGLPDGVRGAITFTGPSVQTATASQTLSVGSGPWSVTADRVTVADPRVRTVYLPTVSPTSFCLSDRGTQAVTVTWSRVATSNALWAINGTTTTQFVGFRSSQLAATSSQPASVGVKGAFGRDVAFDLDGNVWVAGPTTTDALLNRFPAVALASSGMATPDRQLSVRGLSCIPAATALAFDRAGNLYVASACANEVQRIDASQLSGSGEVSASLTLPVEDPGGLAFDAAGNLWVASKQDDRVWRFDASQLTGSAASAPALKLGVRASSDPMNMALAKPAWLAFDTRGDLWLNDFGANTFSRVRAANLAGTGTTTAAPQVRITLGVTALLEGFAFDGQGGLWSAGVQGTLVRLAPGQLDVSSGPGAPTMPETIITSSDLGYASNLAFYPAPAGLPLFHALP